MPKKIVKWFIVMMVLIIGVGGGTVAANNDNELSQQVYESSVSAGSDIEEVTDIDETTEVDEQNDDEEVEAEIPDTDTVETTEEVEVIEEVAEAPKPGTADLTETVEVKNDNLPSNAMLVSDFNELKTAIESRGNGKGITTYYLSADIVATSGIEIPSSYSFTIDGTNPLTNERHSYTEYESISSTNTINLYGGTINATFQNIDLYGNNNSGFIYISTNGVANILFDNVRYTGPRMAYNRSGTTVFRNSDIYIGNRDGHVSYSGIVDVAATKYLNFEGHNIIAQTENASLPVFRFDVVSQVIFRESSVLDADILGGFNNTTSVGVVMYVMKNAQVNINQSKANSAPIFVLQNTNSGFNILEGGSINITRPDTATESSQAIRMSNGGYFKIDGGTLSLGQSGSQTTNPMIDIYSLDIVNNGKIKMSVDGDLSKPFINAHNFTFFGDSGEGLLELKVSGSTYSPLTNTLPQSLRYGIIDVHIGGNANTSLFESTIAVNAINSKLNILIDGDYLSSDSMIKRPVGNSFLLQNAVVDVKVGNMNGSILDGANLLMLESTVKLQATGIVRKPPISFARFMDMMDSTIEFDVKSFGLSAGVQVIPGSTSDTFNMSNSHIKLNVTENLSNTLFERYQLRMSTNSSIEVNVGGNVSTSVFSTSAAPSLGSGSKVDIDIKGNYTSSMPMIGKAGGTSVIITIEQASELKVRVKDLQGPVMQSGSLIIKGNSVVDIEVAGYASAAPLDFYKSPQVMDSTYKVIIGTYYTGSQPLIGRYNATNQNLVVSNSEFITRVGQSSTAQAVITYKVQVTNSKFEINFGTAAIGTKAMVEANSVDIENSNFIVRVDKGTLGPLVQLTGTTGFSYKQGNTLERNNLVLYGPTSTGLIKTPNQSVRISIVAQQFNTYNSIGNGTILDNPVNHYMNEDGKYSAFSINMNNYSTENYSVVVNDFTTSQNNPANTFTLQSSKTKILSAGRIEHENTITASGGKTNITGKTIPGAQVSYGFKIENGGTTTYATADENGDYAMTLDTAAESELTMRVIGDFLFLTNEYIVEHTGSLRFGAMPGTIAFNDLMIPTTATQFQRKVVTPDIEIIDDRSGGGNWKLELVLVDNVHDPLGLRPDLENVLIYKDATGTRTLKPGKSIEIARSDSNTDPNHMINWTEDTGLFLFITDPGSIYTGTNYEANLQWVLTDLG